MITSVRNTSINDSEEKIKKLINIRDRHLNCFEEYENIVKSSSYKLMSKSKNSSLYGMYMSDDDLVKYFWDKGLKLTKEESKRDFVYYFDDKNQLLLSERYNANGVRLLSWNFFYYYENYTEIIKYSPEDKRIFRVALINYKNGVLDSFLESGYMIKGVVDTYSEYLFNLIPNTVVKKTYSDNLEKTTEIVKLH